MLEASVENANIVEDVGRAAPHRRVALCTRPTKQIFQGLCNFFIRNFFFGVFVGIGSQR